MLTLLHNRDAVEVVSDARLSVLTQIVANSFNVCSVFILHSSRLMVANGVFGEQIHDLALLVTVAVGPGCHILHHLTLNLRVLVVKIRMEP